MATVEQRFKKAVFYVRALPPGDTTTERKLEFYKYFKQATEGDVKGSQPWAVQLEARAKWDAWNSVKGMAAEEAMRLYAKLLDDSDASWETNPLLQGYTEQ
eukprot:m.43365 g.43365  ORF g.43365 m.43365 type:complete len:101 (+) comp12209_c0_seq2:92-394(+)